MLGALLLFWLIASIAILGGAFIANGNAEPSGRPVPPRVPWTRQERRGWLIIFGALALAVGMAYAGHVFHTPRAECAMWKVYTFAGDGTPLPGPVDPCQGRSGN